MTRNKRVLYRCAFRWRYLSYDMRNILRAPTSCSHDERLHSNYEQLLQDQVSFSALKYIFQDSQISSYLIP